MPDNPNIPHTTERAQVFNPDDLHLAAVNQGHSWAVIRYTPEVDPEFGCPTYREITTLPDEGHLRAYLAGLEYGERHGYNRAANTEWPLSPDTSRRVEKALRSDRDELLQRLAETEKERDDAINTLRALSNSPLRYSGIECPTCHSRETRVAGVNANQREHELRCATCSCLFWADTRTSFHDEHTEREATPREWRLWLYALAKAATGWERETGSRQHSTLIDRALTLAAGPDAAVVPAIAAKFAARLIDALHIPHTEVADLFRECQRGEAPNLLAWLRTENTPENVKRQVSAQAQANALREYLSLTWGPCAKHGIRNCWGDGCNPYCDTFPMLYPIRCRQCDTPIYKMPDNAYACDYYACDHQGCPLRGRAQTPPMRIDGEGNWAVISLRTEEEDETDA